MIPMLTEADTSPEHRLRLLNKSVGISVRIGWRGDARRYCGFWILEMVSTGCLRKNQM